MPPAAKLPLKRPIGTKSGSRSSVEVVAAAPPPPPPPPEEDDEILVEIGIPSMRKLCGSDMFVANYKAAMAAVPPSDVYTMHANVDTAQELAKDPSTAAAYTQCAGFYTICGTYNDAPMYKKYQGPTKNPQGPIFLVRDRAGCAWMFCASLDFNNIWSWAPVADGERNTRPPIGGWQVSAGEGEWVIAPDIFVGGALLLTRFMTLANATLSIYIVL